MKKSIPHASQAEEQARAEADLLRRAAVCTRLKAIAAETGDEELKKEAEQLDQRAWALYTRRITLSPDSNMSSGDVRTAERFSFPPIPAAHSNDGPRNALSSPIHAVSGGESGRAYAMEDQP